MQLSLRKLSQMICQTRAVPQNPPNTQTESQTRRILGIIPNFRAVSTDQKLPAQSVKEKFATATATLLLLYGWNSISSIFLIKPAASPIRP